MSFSGYLQEKGTINLARLEVYLKAVAQNDIDNFQDSYADIKWLESKQGGNEEAAAAKHSKLKKVSSPSLKSLGLSKCLKKI